MSFFYKIVFYPFLKKDSSGGKMIKQIVMENSLLISHFNDAYS